MYMYTNFLFVYPASFVGKRFTSTKEVNIFLEQVSINIGKTLDWVNSPLFFCYLGPFNQGCLNSSVPPPPHPPKKTPSLLSEKKRKKREKKKKKRKKCT